MKDEEKEKNACWEWHANKDFILREHGEVILLLLVVGRNQLRIVQLITTHDDINATL